MNKMCASVVSLCAALTSGAGLAVAAETAPGQYQRYHFKEAQPLRLDVARVAVQLPEGVGIGDVAASLAKSGLAMNGAEAWPTHNWWLIPVAKVGAVGADIEATVAALAANPQVAFASPVFFGDNGLPMFPTRQILAQFAEGTDLKVRDALLAGVGVIKAEEPWAIIPGGVRAQLGTKDGFAALRAANALAGAASTKFAENDVMFTGTHGVIPNDTFFGDLWGLHNTGQAGGTVDADMDAPEAWDITTGVAGVLTVMLDVGCDMAHADLNLAGGNDLTGNGTGGGPGNVCDNHGTSVASCISGRFNNALGVTGVAPATRVLSARIGVSSLACNGSWSGSLSWSADALNWGAGLGARVSNNSNSYGSTSATVETAYANTYAINNMVHFASAGNGGFGAIAYPSSIANVNSVAALHRSGNRAGFSQWGPGLDFSAPGETILACDRTGAPGYVGGDFVFVDGTSFAGPYAAGVAALIISRNGALTSPQVETIMRNTCVNLGPAGYDTDFGWGFVNAFAAVVAASPPVGNDSCGGAINVSSGGTFNGTLIGATNDGAYGACGSATTNADVWYTFTAPAAGTLTASTCGTHDAPGVNLGIDTVLSIVASCGGAELACSDDAFGPCGSLDTSTLRDSLTTTVMAAGETVKIRVSKFGASAVGPFRLNVSFAIANDACAAAVDVSSGGTFNGTLLFATNDGAYGSCGLATTNPDAWYTYTNTACAPVLLVASTCGTHDAAGVNTGIDTVLSIVASCGGAELACNDDAFGPCGALDTSTLRDSYGTAVVGIGQTVKIRVSKFGSGPVGPFRLNVSATLANDNCANAVAVGNGVTPFCDIGAITDGPTESFCNFCCGDFQVNGDIWYSYVAGATGLVDVTVCDTATTFDTKLAVYAGACPGGPDTAISCNDDSFCAVGGLKSELTFSAGAGGLYLIRVGGYANSRGSGNLIITPRPTCGSADFDADGDTGTDADVEAFLACVGGNCCAACGSADFDGDGDTGTDADIEAFFRVLGGGAC